MRIACPSCAATYDVPDTRLKPGKMVRCARCGGEWLPDLEPKDDLEAPGRARRSGGHADSHAADHGADHEAAQHAAERSDRPALTAMDRLASPPPPSPPARGLIGAWVLTAVVLVAAVSASIIWRQDFMRAWPPSSRILAPFGQEPAKPGQIPGKTAG